MLPVPFATDPLPLTTNTDKETEWQALSTPRIYHETITTRRLVTQIRSPALHTVHTSFYTFHRHQRMRKAFSIFARIMSIALTFAVLTFGVAAIADTAGWRLPTINQMADR